MPRTFTAAQLANLQANATKPVVVVRWAHSGVEERLSCAGNVVFDGEVYEPGGVNVRRSEDGNNATLRLPADPVRIGEVHNGTWRGGICQLYLIPAPANGELNFTASEGILFLDGMISKSRLVGEQIVVNAINKHLGGKITPRNTYTEFSSYLEPPGRGLEARR